MEMITKKLMEKNTQGAGAGPVANNTEKSGLSLNDSKPQNNEDSGCC